MKSEKGLSLIELVIALSLLSVVLAVGYLFYSFGNTSFVAAEGRSDVQQNVRIAADFISKELRNATFVHILSSEEAIPSHDDIASFDEHYIFLNDDDELEYRTKGVSRLLLQGIAAKTVFDIDFSVDGTNRNLLAFNISGTRDTGHEYALNSKVYLENLALNDRIITGSGSGRLRFIKTPSAAPVIISVEPNSVLTAQSFKETFTLTLYNDRFISIDKSKILLGNDFLGLSVDTYALIKDTEASITLSGTLNRDKGSGIIEVPSAGLAGGVARAANVLVEVPIGYLLATPNPIAAGSLSGEVFTLTLTDIENSFKELLSENITLGGDFLGLTVSDIAVDSVNNKIASLKLSENLVYSTGSGTITVGADALSKGSGLTANVKVEQPVVATFSLNIVHDGQGTSEPAPGTHQYNPGETVALSATAGSEWMFVRWVVGSDIFVTRNISVVMDGTKAATAVFSRLPDVIVNSIAYSASTNKKELYIDVSAVDTAGNPVTGSTTVSISIRRDGTLLKTLSGTTTNGRIRFTENYQPNIPDGTYTSVVTSVSNANYNWNKVTPSNSFVFHK